MIWDCSSAYGSNNRKNRLYTTQYTYKIKIKKKNEKKPTKGYYPGTVIIPIYKLKATWNWYSIPDIQSFCSLKFLNHK